MRLICGRCHNKSFIWFLDVLLVSGFSLLQLIGESVLPLNSTCPSLSLLPSSPSSIPESNTSSENYKLRRTKLTIEEKTTCSHLQPINSVLFSLHKHFFLHLSKQNCFFFTCLNFNIFSQRDLNPVLIYKYKLWQVWLQWYYLSLWDWQVICNI